MARFTKLQAGTGSAKVYIYAEKKSDLDAFFSGTTVVSAGNITEGTAAVPGTTRRQYPGDSTPVSVKAHSRVFIKGGSEPGNTLPGKPFTCEVTTGVGVLRKTVVKQFTFTGAFTDLQRAAESGAAMDFVLRSPSGRPYLMAP